MKIPIVPAAYFGMVLGLAGLGTSWRFAAQAWGLPAAIGEAIMGLAVGIYERLLAEIVAAVGLFFWLAIESVLVHRFLTSAAMAEALRPTFGIQLAPAPVGLVAYLAVTARPPDLFANLVVGLVALDTLWLLVRGQLKLKWTGAPVELKA